MEKPPPIQSTEAVTNSFGEFTDAELPAVILISRPTVWQALKQNTERRIVMTVMARMTAQ